MSTPFGSPPAEVEIDNALVLRLLRQQHPRFAKLPISRAVSGWDNELFRLGDDAAVRLPRRKAATQAIENELNFLPGLAPRLPLPVPAPVGRGEPGCGYPWTWAIVPWLRGASIEDVPLASNQGSVLGRFLAALHHPPPHDAPHNPVRGVALAERAHVVADRMDRLSIAGVDLPESVKTGWERALSAPVSNREPTWIHGDLHGRNVLGENGCLTAVVDWGDVSAGDSATDLCSLWTLLSDDDAIEEALSAYGRADNAMIARGRGWATLLGVVLLLSLIHI